MDKITKLYLIKQINLSLLSYKLYFKSVLNYLAELCMNLIK